MGLVKKTKIEDFKYITTKGKIAIKLREEDELGTVIPLEAEKEIILVSNIGLAVRFNSSEIREMGRASFGVLGMRLVKGSYVVDAEVIEENDRVVLVTEKGFGKITKVKEIRKTKRGKKGVRCIKIDEKTGNLVAVKLIKNERKLIFAF